MEAQRPRRVCLLTSTRADWGLLQPLAGAWRRDEAVQLQIVATGTHLSAAFGMTAREIEADGFAIDRRVPWGADPADAAGCARAAAETLAGVAAALGELAPDIAVILGDRYEMLAAAQACALMGVPIAHIAGGETTEGAVDDNLRHAITKLAALHFPQAEPYARRLVQMGEAPDRVFCAGSLGVANALAVTPVPRQELQRQTGLPLDRDTLLVTFHPATLDGGASPADRFRALLGALDALPRLRVLFTYPNADAGGGRDIITLIDHYASLQPAGRCAVAPSLGRVRYLSALRYVGAVVGNSSSALMEAPSLGCPAVDIGTRQRGRLAGPSVLHCGDSAPEITRAIETVLTPAFRQAALRAPNPYAGTDTVARIASTVARYPLEELRIKHFHDL